MPAADRLAQLQSLARWHRTMLDAMRHTDLSTAPAATKANHTKHRRALLRVDWLAHRVGVTLPMQTTVPGAIGARKQIAARPCR